jgi:hypothetical protein
MSPYRAHGKAGLGGAPGGMGHMDGVLESMVCNSEQMSKDLTKRSLEVEVEFAIQNALRELLETKHLYQSVTIDFGKARSLLPQICDEKFQKDFTIVSHNRVPSQEGIDSLKNNIRQALADRMVNWVKGSWFLVDDKTAKTVAKSLGSEEQRINTSRFAIPSIKTFCTKCNSGPWPHNPARESGDRGYSFEANESSLYAQTFSIPYQCQSCKKDILVFLIKRDGEKLTLVGRNQFPEVSIPNFIPNNQEKFYRNAIIADQTGFILAAALYMRTIIEQYFYEVIPSKIIAEINGNPTGDELAELYAKTLPKNFPSNFPSLRKAYDDLSVIIHSGQENDKVRETFLSIRTAIDGHFKAVRLFKEMPIK